MLALTQTATLYRRTGIRDAKPAYAPEGLSVRCRIQQRDEGGAIRSRKALVFCEPVEAKDGDLMVFEDGSALTVRSVETVRGLDRTHHLEIEARSEG